MLVVKSAFAMAMAGIILCSPIRAETIRVGGIGAAQGLLHALGDGFSRSSPSDNLEIIPGLGSSGALAATAAGELSLTVSGRSLSAAEQGQGLVAVPFAETPLAFVHAGRNPLDVSLADLVRIHSGALDKSPAGEPIRLILRPATDAATQYISKSIPGMSEALEQARRRVDFPIAATDQDNMEIMRRVPGAFASMTLAQLTTEANQFQRVRVAGVEPSLEMMKTGIYPFKLSMALVTKGVPSPGLKRFLAFLVTEEAGKIIESAGVARLRGF